MHIQVLLDATGDTRHQFTADDSTSVERAKSRFDDLVSRGYQAYALGRDGAPARRLDIFDPATETTVFVPRLQGG